MTISPARFGYGEVARLKMVRASQRGSTLLMLLLLSAVAAVALASAFTYVSRSASLRQRSELRLEAIYAAEYAFENAFQRLKTAISITNVPDITQTTSATNLTTAPTDVFKGTDGYVWKSYLTVPIEDGIVVDAHTPSVDPSRGSYKYLSVVELERAAPTMPQPVRLSFQREWVYELKPLFQYAIFYNTDMELFPGATFVVGGRVHSNGKIYTGTSASITFEDYVTSVDGLSNSYSLLDPRGPGSPGNTITYNQEPIVTTREDPPGVINADATDYNVNNDGPRELIEIPDHIQDDANADDRLYNEAGLKVLANTTSSAVTTASGVTVPAHSRVYVTADGTQIPAGDPLAIYLDTMFSTGGMNDYRENVEVITTDIDVGMVTAGTNAGGLPQILPAGNWANDASVPEMLQGAPINPNLQGKELWNGVLYVADVTDSAAHPTGIKIVNGASLPNGTNPSSPAKGLTIVSQNAAYVVGDYNTGGNPAVNSSASANAKNYVDGYTSPADAANGFTVQPAAIAADAVTVVSSNWTSKNYDDVAGLSSRTPVNTTINTALISGIVPSNGAAYSGGVENYIRLLENWSGGKRLTYYGSIINLYNSEQAKAVWQNTGNYYNAPSRNWHFDAQFKNPNRLPPGTPTLRTVRKGQWVQLQ